MCGSCATFLCLLADTVINNCSVCSIVLDVVQERADVVERDGGFSVCRFRKGKRRNLGRVFYVMRGLGNTMGHLWWRNRILGFIFDID